jgi:hypothetical protein
MMGNEVPEVAWLMRALQLEGVETTRGSVRITLTRPDDKKIN